MFKDSRGLECRIKIDVCECTVFLGLNLRIPVITPLVYIYGGFMNQGALHHCLIAVAVGQLPMYQPYRTTAHGPAHHSG